MKEGNMNSAFRASTMFAKSVLTKEQLKDGNEFIDCEKVSKCINGIYIF